MKRPYSQRLEPPIRESQPESLHSRIEKAVASYESSLQQGSFEEVVEQLESVFPSEVEAYNQLQSLLDAEPEAFREGRRQEEARDELQPFNGRVLAAWEELAGLGDINIRGLRAMVSGESRDPLTQSAIWPEGFDSMDYNYGSGSGDNFIGSSQHESFVGTALPIIKERVQALQGAVGLWNVANEEALSYLKTPSEDDPIPEG